jgi:hypothetical protein
MADVNYGVGMRRKVEKAQMRSVIILRTDRKLAGIEDDFLPTYGVLALPYLGRYGAEYCAAGRPDVENARTI